MKPLYGLILAGGESRRMKTDKSMLRYHGKTQVEHASDLLAPFCDKVFISIRADQEALPVFKNFPQIIDHYDRIGPLGGILSAMTQYPRAAWLVMACDLPFVTESVIEQLLARRDRKKMATAYKSRHDGLPEPLCAVYEPHFIATLKENVSNNIVCPRKIMTRSDIALLAPAGNDALDNINNPDEYKKALAAIRHNHGKD